MSNIVNNQKILIAQIIAILICSIIGTLLHFTFELSNENKFVALFSAVNESTWEHLKLTFFPIVLIGIFEYFFIGKEANNYIESKAIAAILSMTIVTVLFYTYVGIIGKNNFIIDIAIFFMGIIISELLAYRMMLLPDFSTTFTQVLSILVVALTIFLFGNFTFNPPRIQLFKDPINGKYGILNLKGRDVNDRND